MSLTVLLDAGPLGLVTNPRRSQQSLASARWLQTLLTSGALVIVPEIADYEVRRELIRAEKMRGLQRLDALINLTTYLPINTTVMRQAAQFWADARQQGRPSASDDALDADVILAAQAVTLNEPDVIVATTNVAHLAGFVAADLWTNIVPTSQ